MFASVPFYHELNELTSCIIEYNLPQIDATMWQKYQRTLQVCWNPLRNTEQGG